MFSEVQFSCSVVANSLRLHEPQHARPPCPSSAPGVHPNSSPSSRWCHSTISSSVVPFSSFPRSFPASGSFQMSQLFARGGQSIGVSAATSVLPMNIQDWSHLGWTGWISLQRRDSQESSPTPQFKSINSSALSFHVHPYMTTGKTIALTIRTFVGKVMSLFFNMLSRIAHSFSSKEQTSFNFMAAVTICSDFGAQENKVSHSFHCFSIYLPWRDGTGCHDLGVLSAEF